MSPLSSFGGLLLIAISTHGAPTTITGHIYCDNYFEFHFNGKLIAKDPLTFTPHNAVKVSFEWDGVSDRHYAIMCQDFASSSGYEYTSTSSPKLGDGALMARFSDGVATSKAWQSFVVTHGPTAASVSAGCSASNLAACKLETTAEPAGWTESGFKASTGWNAATEYTAAVAGWGRTPSWSGGKCCTSTSPMTKSSLTLNGGCSVNYDASAPTVGLAATVSADECLDPTEVLSESTSNMIWGSSLEKDNRMLFTVTVPANETLEFNSFSGASGRGITTHSTCVLAAAIGIAVVALAWA